MPLSKAWAVALAMVVIWLPVRADIASYNAAMQQRDYTAAAAAAASTWPTLIPSRNDYAVIAREFGFAAYLAGDFAAARSYGEAAVAASNALGEEPVLRSGSELVLRLAQFRLDPDQTTRDALYTALEGRAVLPGIDMLTYLAVKVLTFYDFERAQWRRTVDSASLGERLTRQGGPEYSTEALRFGLVAKAAGYLYRSNMAAYDAVEEHRRVIIEAIASYPAGEDDQDIVRLYHESVAWLNTLRMHLVDAGKFRGETQRERAAIAEQSDPTFLKAMMRVSPPLSPGVCPVVLTEDSPRLNYPTVAGLRGMFGTVVLQVDINEQGGVENAQIMAAVPLMHFGDAVLAGAEKFRFVASADAPPGCKLAQEGKLLNFQFEIED